MARYINKRYVRIPFGEVMFYPSGRITVWFLHRMTVVRKGRAPWTR
jgi:hypothetical protein